MAPFDERRQTIRIAVTGNLNVESVTPGQSLRLVDVGMGGFCAHSMAPIPLGVVAPYRFVTADRKWMAVFGARAVYTKLVKPEGQSKPGYVTGFSFVDTDSPAAQRQLMMMLDHATAFVTFS